MKRKIAFLLLTVALAALLVPAALAEESGAVPVTRSSAEAAAPAQSVPAGETETASGTEAQPPAETAAQTPAEWAPAAGSVAIPAKAGRAEEESDISFTNLRERLEKDNYTYLALEESLKTTGSVTGGLEDALAALKSTYNALAEQQGLLAFAGNDPEVSSAPYFGPLSVTLMTVKGLLKSQIDSMEEQIHGGNTTIDTAQNTLINTQNQMVKGVETLYIGIVTMEAAMDNMDRGLETLSRMTALTEKRQELGMASVYDVESVRHQYNALQSQRESLIYQIKTSKITLEGMLGVKDKDGASVLEPLTLPTEAELAAVDYKTQVDFARKQNVDVRNASAKDWNEGTKAAEYELRGAEDTFDYKFKLLCLAVPEQERLVRAAQETLDFQNRTLEIAAKKYEMGMLSHEEYLSAENDRESARSDLLSAQLNLFTAYRSYWWGYQHGIV